MTRFARNSTLAFPKTNEYACAVEIVHMTMWRRICRAVWRWL
jgi:hypothetical protein